MHTLRPERLAVCSLTLEQLFEAAWVFGLELDVRFVPHTPDAPETGPVSPPAPPPAGTASIGFDEALAA